MKLITFAAFVSVITIATAQVNNHLSDDGRVDTFQADPKIRQSILKGRQLNPHKSIVKRMVYHNSVPAAVSTDAYQQDQMSNAFAQFSSFMASRMPPPGYNQQTSGYNPPTSSFMGPRIDSPRPMIRCVRYPCPTIPAPSRANSPPPPPSSYGRSNYHHRPPPRASRKKEVFRDSSETEEQTTEQEERTSSSREEEPENPEKPEKEESEVTKPEQEENENEKPEVEKPEKQESENRPGPGEEP